MESPGDLSLSKELGFVHLLQAVPDVLIFVDQEGQIVLANARTESLFGYKADDLIGQPLEMLIPEEFREAHIRQRRLFSQDPQARPMGLGLNLQALHADGSQFPVEISLSPMETRQGTLVIAAIRDVTEWRRSEDMFRRMMEAAPDAMLIVDTEGAIQLVNSQAEEILGYSRQELLGESLEMLVPTRFRPDHSGLRQSYHGNPHVRPMGAGLELFAVHKDGSEIPVEIGLSPVETHEGMWIIAALRDISKAKRLQDQLAVLSVTDQLTGLLNRRGFLEVGSKLSAVARRTGSNLLMVMLDIDGLKEINDQLGHSVGDQCIQDVAQVLQESVRDADVIARWGGDEFLVLGLETEKASPEAIVERINANLSQYQKDEGRAYPLSLSIGVAVGPADGDQPFEELINAADRRMYRQKHSDA